MVVEHVLAHPVVEAIDTLTGYAVAVGEASYGGRDRLLAVIYEDTGYHLEVVTVHPIRPSQSRMRVQRGRWRSL